MKTQVEQCRSTEDLTTGNQQFIFGEKSMLQQIELTHWSENGFCLTTLVWFCVEILRTDSFWLHSILCGRLTAITQLAHHGMVYVPIGYTFGAGMFEMNAVKGGSPYGAGTFAGDGTRQPTKLELEQAVHQGKYTAGFAKRLKIGGPWIASRGRFFGYLHHLLGIRSTMLRMCWQTFGPAQFVMMYQLARL